MTRRNPQVERTRRAVLEAAGAVLLERGFGAATIDAVSAGSRVARSTIYRHWPDLETLLIEAFEQLAGGAPEPSGCGDLRADLVSVFTRLAHGLEAAPSLQVLPSLADAAHRDPRLDDLLARFIDRRREPARSAIRDAIARDEIPPGTDTERLLDVIGGALFYRRLVSRQPVTEPGLVEYLVDSALCSLVPGRDDDG
ncbi:MAG: TetR/AcrR family transcriptional regulator [Pseudonocardia sp.]|nr:TetR/AcrR family transcriptional regulator [Pseudonocardia sp.]